MQTVTGRVLHIRRRKVTELNTAFNCPSLCFHTFVFVRTGTRNKYQVTNSFFFCLVSNVNLPVRTLIWQASLTNHSYGNFPGSKIKMKRGGRVFLLVNIKETVSKICELVLHS